MERFSIQWRISTKKVIRRLPRQEVARGVEAVSSLADDADVPALAARSEALCERRPLYPGFRGYGRYGA